MRRAANVDKNQPEIVAKLRSAGVTVECLHSVGGGCPDLLCGFRGVNVLIEIKDPSETHNQAQQGLNVAQQEWHSKWSGQRHVARTFDEAMDEILRVYKLQSRGAGLVA